MNTIIKHEWILQPTPKDELPTSADLGGRVRVQQRYTDQGYPIGMMTVDGSQEGGGSRMLHIQPPWSEAVLDRTDARPRALAFAQAMGSRAIVIDAPGIGLGVPRLPKDVIKDIWGGNLHSVATMQASATNDVWRTQGVNELFGFGASQGAIMLAASMATAPESKPYDGVILFEPTGLFPQGIPTFVGRFAVDTMIQQQKLEAYRAETPGEGEDIPGNPAHMRKLAGAILRHPAHYAAYVAAMSQGGLEADLTLAYERGIITDSTELVFVTGTDSTVSPVEWNDRRARSIRQNIGVGSVHLVEIGGANHAIYDSTGRVHQAIDRIRKEIFALPTYAE